MVGCIARFCANSTEKGIRTFRFPADPKRRAEWIIKCRRDKWEPTGSSRLCETHFDNDQFELKREDGRKLLKKSAIPTLFFRPDRQNDHSSVRPPQRRILEEVREEENSVGDEPINDDALDATSEESELKKEMRKLQKHFEENQWEVTRVDGKKKLKANAIPTLFDAAVKRKAKSVAGKRRKQLRTDDEAVIEYIERLEAIKHPPECIVCSRPLDGKKECLSTLTTTTGHSLYHYLLGISSNKTSKIKQCSASDSVCYCCAHLINYADKLEAELAKLKLAINGCLQIKSLSEEEQAILKPEFDSHVAILDVFGERVVGPGSTVSRDAELSDNSDNGRTKNVMEEVITALGALDSRQVEEKVKKSVWKNKNVEKVKKDKVKEHPASAVLKAEPPVLKCKICHLRTTSHSILLFHLRRHMASYQTCDFCDIRLLDDGNEVLDSKMHSAAKL